MQESNMDKQDKEWKRPIPMSSLKPQTLTRISEVMILDSHCGLLVMKRSLQDIPHRKAYEVFSKHMKILGQKLLNPYFRSEGIDFFYLNKNDIFLVAAHTSPESDDPISVILYLDFLQRLYDILKDCIGTVNEPLVTVNKMLIFELLDEIMNFGYCFVSSFNEVKHFLTLEPIKPKIQQTDDLACRFFGITVGDAARHQTGNTELKSKVPNSAYINIVEGLSAVLGSDGQLRSSELWGKLTLISTLEQPAPIIIQLNPDLVILSSADSRGQVAGAVHIENPSFHVCVDTTLLVKKKVLKILPPPDQTRLMVYTLSDSACIHIPVIVIPSLTAIDESKDYNLSLRLINQANSTARASYIKIKVKLPSWITSISTTKFGENQSTQFDNVDKCVEWEVNKSTGGSEANVIFRLINPSDKSVDLVDVGPISVSFYITQFSASGLVVNMAKVESPSADSSGTQPNCFFGVSTKSASFTIRTDPSKE